MKLTGKTVLITGASSGIGEAVALRCAGDNCTIILAARRVDKLNEVKAKVEAAGSTAEVFQCDVSDPNQVRSLFKHAIRDGRVLDVVFDNAGLGHIGPLVDLTTTQVKQMVDVNILGMMNVAKFAAEVFTRQKYGHLVITSSMAGLITLPQWSVYVASKWATLAFADAVRFELAPLGINVTTLHPGAVKTEFFDREKADIDIAKLGGAIEADAVADEVYNSFFTKRKRILIPGNVKVFAWLYKYIPGLANYLITKQAGKIKYHQSIVEDEPDFSDVKEVVKR